MKTKLYKVALIVVLLSFYGYVNANESDKLTITGQVVDYMASPVEGAEIAIINSEYYDGEYYTKVIASFVKTDENGHFEVQADVTSQYDTYIVARKEGLAYAWDGLNYSNNKKGKGIFLLVLEKANTLTGKVVDYQGNAVSGAAVQAVPKTSYLSRLLQRPISGPKEWFTTETDSDGVFSFDYFSQDVSSDFHVKAPNWNCTYKYTTHYQNACGFEVWRSDIKLVLPQESKASGRVVEAVTGKSIEGVELLIQTGRDREDILNRYLPFTVVSGSDGSFVCDGLPEGKNTLELVVEETQTPDWIAEPVEFEVTPNELAEDIVVKLKKGEIVEYTVRRYDTEQPLPEINVSTYNENFSARSITNQRGITRQRVLSGEYQAYAGGDGYISWQVNEPVIVKEGEVTSLDIELTKSPTVNGTVFNMDSKPTEDIMVTIYPYGDYIYTNSEGKFDAWYEQRWAGNGLYVMARDIPRNLAAIFHTNDFNEPSQLSLGPALTVKGKIADTNGNGISAARVSMSIYFDSQNVTSDFGTEVLTDAQGMFELKAVPAIPDELEYWAGIQSTGFVPRTYTIHNINDEPDRIIDLGNIELQPANMSISGTVEDANGLRQPYSIMFLSGREGVRQPRKNTATEEQGRFEMRGLCEGPVTIRANFSSDPKGSGTTSAHAGDKDIKIILGRGLVHTQHQSSLGKSLPDISELGTKLEDAEGKVMLVCFFDYQQRPSRNCILELSKRAEELSAKNILSIAVQASKVDKSTLDGWIEENNITFPVGVIEENEEQTRFNWGIKSLPWLILTDAEHIVIAEGFSVNELDEKIQN